MESLNNETYIFVARCKCCLNEGDLKNLWEPYVYEDETEIYGTMLSECFALPWNQPEEHLQWIEMICNSCIKRLRDAVSFRREVLASDEVLHENQDKMFLHAIVKENELQLGKETDYQDIEYLDVSDGAIKQPSVNNLSTDELQINETQITEETKRRGSKKLPKEDRNKTYKQYTVKALKMAIDAVLNNKMSQSRASKTYGVPRKTITAKLHTGLLKKDEIDDDATKLYEQEKHYKLIEEIKTILTYTNAIPYKSKASRYYCAYCSTDGPTFDDPDDLRTHTRTKHVHERTTSIEQMMKPQWLNEVLKLDIYSLHCTVCCTVILKWNDMFRHLEEVHGVFLDEAYNKVIPYILSRELNCALCGESYTNYHKLDGHMNAHYSSYICYECGDTFLAATRLNKHIEVHKFGQYPCKACGKVFKLKKYMKKHFDFIHGKEQKIKCRYCTEKFYGMFERHQHVMKMHRERVKVMTCEMCGKTFDWRPYYATHMRRIHGTDKNYKCKICDKSFSMKYELKNHRVKHETEKNFICDVCCRRFKSKPGLLKHQQMHYEPVSNQVLIEKIIETTEIIQEV